MNIDSILEYQKIDADLIALETEIARSKERAAVAAAKSKLDAATENIGRLSAEAGDILAAYDKMKAKIDSLKVKLDEFDGIIEGIEDEGEADYYLKSVNAIADEIASLEKEASHDALRIDEINVSYKNTWEQGIEATGVFKTARAEYENFKKEREERFNQINASLQKLKKNIPEKYMSAYATLRAARKLPAFVEFDPAKGICGRCFMELANDTRSRLKNPGDIAECPHCGRILYIPEN
jgi:predicted  nucleic acid-binding Zn-ribbon protein